MEETRKGTVTSLSSVFPAEEAQKAVKRVQDTISDKKSELDYLRGFVADNNNLINLVHKLPEQLSHDIMVPFGKAAFFPGRLVHTNEFLVLLGEGYYAERTSKQTVEILTRRGKSLDSRVDSIEAIIKDLQAEASFFNATASEALEGLVEIREDYVEEDCKQESKSGSLKQSAPNFGKTTADDQQYARMMSRLDELEKQEELASESGNHSDQSEETTSDTDDISYQRPTDNNLQSSQDFRQGMLLDQTKNKSMAAEIPKKQNHQEDIADQLNFASLAVQSKVQEKENVPKKVRFVDQGEKLVHPEEKIVKATTASKGEVQHQTSQTSFDSRKAFTGSIIEHAENIKASPIEQSSTLSQVSGSQPKKPVSRFRMQRK
ncbi:putative prefoldin alpha [Lupinus albus]|uniref:Putative prefoldin alpha n=1 Tax=Lupinus albus TaxID=3870 RepID=A0A6A4QTY8_LUPAL|nr:putative prefoldin alpha [Lupinus albus]